MRNDIFGIIDELQTFIGKQEEQSVGLDSGKSLATWNTIMDSWRSALLVRGAQSQQYKFSDYLVNYQMLA